MAFEESAPIWIAVPISLVVLVAALVFTFGFKGPVDQSQFFIGERNETDNSRKKRKKTKATPALITSARRSEESSNPAKKKPVSKSDSKSKNAVETTVAKKVVPAAKPQESKPQESKKEEAKKQVESAEEEFGEWEVAKSRKRPQKGKELKLSGSKSDSGSVASNTVEKLRNTTKPNVDQASEPPARDAALDEQNTSKNGVQEDEGPSTGHSEAASTLSDSWVNPDEVHSALKEFDLALTAQANTASSKDSPTLNKDSKKKNKKKKSTKTSSEGAGVVNPDIPVVEEVVSRKEVVPLGDRGNPYRVVDQTSSASSKKTKEMTSKTTDAPPAESTPATSEDWVEAKVQKKKKRVRRDN